MTPKEFAAFLESPESSQFSVEQIENLLKQYPYSQSLRIAFLKKLRLSNHPNFEKHLHKTATYAYDRVFLKRYINKEPIYVIEYPAMKVEAEQLETLELMPLDKLQGEKVEHSIFDNIPDEPEQKQQLTFPSENWEEAVEDELEIFNVEETTEEVAEVAENIAETVENEVVETVENVEETTEEVVEVAENIEETVENEVVETVENVEETTEEVVEVAENIEETVENEVVETVENVEETTEEVVEVAENIAETVENDVVDKIKKSMDNNEISKSELQKIILKSKKIEEHASIEEDIDNLLYEDDLETLDDEIEFGFEIDKKIINDQDDFSLFDKEHHHVDEHHHQKEHDENDEHASKKLRHQWIHEQINESEHHESVESSTNEVEKSEKLDEETNDTDLSPNNIFTKDELIEEGGLYFLDVIEDVKKEEKVVEESVEEEEPTSSPKSIAHFKFALTEEEKDPEELPLEEEEEIAPSTENVEEIRATLLNHNTDKQTKKQRVKSALVRISKIPLSEIGVITETYGDLLAKQGKIEHAIRLYQQLILKNPQKKVYFAAKIKQLIKKM